ncbi:MAG: efflux RND transporter periplasmic adaptor subunit [Bacteroidetes bacterium]|nr:MAG: efflux RND transporter periplasmic adaptor subunit [Bacteroidota bacterium]
MANGKKNKKKIIILALIGVIGIALVLVVILGGKKENVVSVQTEAIGKRTITQIVNASGKIQPETMVKINAEVSGEITALPVKEGDKVRKGDLLVRIKPDQYQAQVDRAEAGLSSARASLNLQKANLEKVESEFKRAQELYAKTLLSEQEFITAKTSMNTAKSQYESAQAGVRQAEASLRDARESLAKTAIYAPMNGTVSQLLMELGERVSGSSFTQGTHIMTVADLTAMEARVDVGENDIVTISIGDTSRIVIDAFPDQKFNGVVYEIANTATSKGLGTQDEVTNFQVKIRVFNEKVALRPGMSMTADIETETRRDVLAVPIQSVTTRAPKAKGEEGAKKPEEGESPGIATNEKSIECIFVVEDGKAKMVPVKRGINDEGYVELRDGAKESAEVVSGSYKAINRDLEDGAVVRVDNQAKRFAMNKPAEGK